MIKTFTGLARLSLGLATMLVILTGCAFGTGSPSPAEPDAGWNEAVYSTPSAGTIVSTSKHRVVSRSEVFNRMSGENVIYVGEQHDNPHSHHVQLTVIKRLHQTRRLSIGFELFRENEQHLLDQWSNEEISTKTFRRKLSENQSDPTLIEYYAEILRFARRRDIPLVALKPARKTVEQHRRTLLGSRSDRTGDSPAPQELFLKRTFANHVSTGRGFQVFVGVQQFWEARMAENINLFLRDKNSPNTMVVLTGNYHVAYDFGIPDDLEEKGTWTQASILTWPVDVSLRDRLGFPSGRRPAGVSPADYVWWIPAGQ